MEPEHLCTSANSDVFEALQTLSVTEGVAVAVVKFVSKPDDEDPDPTFPNLVPLMDQAQFDWLAFNQIEMGLTLLASLPIAVKLASAIIVRVNREVSFRESGIYSVSPADAARIYVAAQFKRPDRMSRLCAIGGKAKRSVGEE